MRIRYHVARRTRARAASRGFPCRRHRACGGEALCLQYTSRQHPSGDGGSVVAERGPRVRLAARIAAKICSQLAVRDIKPDSEISIGGNNIAFDLTSRERESHLAKTHVLRRHPRPRRPNDPGAGILLGALELAWTVTGMAPRHNLPLAHSRRLSRTDFGTPSSLAGNCRVSVAQQVWSGEPRDPGICARWWRQILYCHPIDAWLRVRWRTGGATSVCHDT